MGSMRTGSGEHYLILFQNNSAIFKGYDKSTFEREVTFDIISKLPQSERNQINSFIKEPAFLFNQTSFLIWNLNGEWKGEEDHSYDMLKMFNDPINTYLKYCKDYFGLRLAVSDVSSLFEIKSINIDLVHRLNPKRKWKELIPDLNQIGAKYDV
jgi:hypothetical protein